MNNDQEKKEEGEEKQDHYASHLSEVNKTNNVLATEDIYNKNGALVVKKNTLIDKATADRIIQHKLEKSLGEQVEIENSLNSSRLSKDVESLFQKHPDLFQIFTSSGSEETVDNMLHESNIPKIIFQKLTVLKNNLPQYFEKSLFCAILSTMIARELKLLKKDTKVAFIAGLTIDLGFVHLSLDVINKKDELTPEEWRIIQSHVIVGQMIIKEGYGESFPASKAILEHHERCDGSGYPLGKTAKQIGEISQIVGITDDISANKVNSFTKIGRNLRDIIPYLKMNKKTYLLEINNTVRIIIQDSKLQPSMVNPYDNVSALISHLVKNCQKVKNSMAVLKKVLDITEASVKNQAPSQLEYIVNPVVIMMRDSGIVNDEILVWLESLSDDSGKNDLEYLLELDLMQKELSWQFKKIHKAFTAHKEKMADNDNDSELSSENLTKLSEQILEFIT